MALDSELLKVAIRSALGVGDSDGDDAEQIRRRALLPTYETEDAALVQARRIAQLRPGDPIRVLNFDDTGLMRAVFVGFDDKAATFIAYQPKNKALIAGKTSLQAVVPD